MKVQKQENYLNALKRDKVLLLNITDNLQ